MSRQHLPARPTCICSPPINFLVPTNLTNAKVAIIPCYTTDTMDETLLFRTSLQKAVTDHDTIAAML